MLRKPQRHGLFVYVQFANPDFTTPISETVDDVIQNCPIDVRRGLYKVCFTRSSHHLWRLLKECFLKDLWKYLWKYGYFYPVVIALSNVLFLLSCSSDSLFKICFKWVFIMFFRALLVFLYSFYTDWLFILSTQLIFSISWDLHFGNC